METHPSAGFIMQTAKDYDLPYETVERVFDKYEATGRFYDELEKILTDKE